MRKAAIWIALAASWILPAAAQAADCCKCFKGGTSIDRSFCVDVAASTNCSQLVANGSAFTDLRTTDADLVSGVTCESGILNGNECETISSGSSSAQCRVLVNNSVAEIRGALSSLGSSPASSEEITEEEEETPFTPIDVDLGVSIGGVSKISGATREEGVVSVPFIGQYVNIVYRYMVGIVLIVAIVMVVYGGFRYLTGATSGNVAKGKEIIRDAMIGMLLTLGAYVILNTINPATVSFEPLRISQISRGLSDWELEELEADASASLDSSGSGLYTNPAAPSGGSDGFVTVDTSRLERLDVDCEGTNSTAIHLNTPVDPSFIEPLRRAAQRFCELRGSNTSWHIRGGGYRGPELSLRLWLKRCLNRVNCTTGTGAPFRPGVVTTSGVKTFTDPALRAMADALLPAPANPYSDSQIQAIYQRTLPMAGVSSGGGHGLGLAADLFCGGATTNQAVALVECQLILEQAMKDAGFCRIPNEWWHFELASNPRSRFCNPDWAIGRVSVRVGTASTPTEFDYSTCDGRFYYNDLGRGNAARACRR
ncbi:hypothetical protein IT407_04195 [Candidatus Uhrbacteria bacterium]|nr:hypothetical protein [Candidatus Uhrbacteria bacterium]